MYLNEKVKNVVNISKVAFYLMGLASTLIICIANIITIPEKISNHEKRLTIVEKSLNDVKIETVAKLTSLQEDVRIIKEALINK